MALYKSVRELEGVILRERDRIDFLGIRYFVVQNALLHYLDDCNDKIFIALNISDKYKFCSKHLGYEAFGNNLVPNQFPMSKDHDFEALTRVALGIMKLCEN